MTNLEKMKQQRNNEFENYMFTISKTCYFCRVPKDICVKSKNCSEAHDKWFKMEPPLEVEE